MSASVKAGAIVHDVYCLCTDLCTVLKRIVKSHSTVAATVNNTITATGNEGVVFIGGIASGPKSNVKSDANEFKKTADKVVSGPNECHNIANKSGWWWSSWEGGSAIKISFFFSVFAAGFGVWAHLDPTFKFSLFDSKLPSFNSIGNFFKKSDAKQLK